MQYSSVTPPLFYAVDDRNKIVNYLDTRKLSTESKACEFENLPNAAVNRDFSFMRLFSLYDKLLNIVMPA